MSARRETAPSLGALIRYARWRGLVDLAQDLADTEDMLLDDRDLGAQHIADLTRWYGECRELAETHGVPGDNGPIALPTDHWTEAIELLGLAARTVAP